MKEKRKKKKKNERIKEKREEKKSVYMVCHPVPTHAMPVDLSNMPWTTVEEGDILCTAVNCTSTILNIHTIIIIVFTE